VLIGNGWFDPLIQYQAYYNYSVYPGNTYDYDPYNDTVKAEWYNNLYGEDNCYDQTVQCYETGNNGICSNADNFCYKKVEYMRYMLPSSAVIMDLSSTETVKLSYNDE
jgi:hypothetical protein